MHTRTTSSLPLSSPADGLGSPLWEDGALLQTQADIPPCRKRLAFFSMA